MKFGKQIAREARSRWAGEYMNYKELKKVIKEAQACADDQKADHEAQFFHALERELTKVNAFFERKLVVYGARLQQLLPKADLAVSTDGQAANIPQLLTALTELNRDLSRMHQYVDLNITGFRKISKKYDKKLQHDTSNTYMNNIVAAKPISIQRSAFADASMQAVRGIDALKRQLAAGRTPRQAKLDEAVEAMHRAIAEDCADTLSTLLQKGLPDAEVVRGLQQACEVGAAQCCRVLLQMGHADPNTTNDVNDMTPLHVACARSHAAVASVLVEHGADTDRQDANGRRALHHGCMAPSPDCVQVLLRHPTMLDSPDQDGMTALAYAVIRGCTRAVELLTDARADIHSFCNATHDSDAGETPIMLACRMDRVAIVELLLARGVDVRRTDKRGESILHVCCRFGSTASLKAAVSAGGLVDQQDTYARRTPLCLAAISGHLPCAQLLIDSGANAGLTDIDNISPYAHAVYRGFHTISALLKPMRPPVLPPAATVLKPSNGNGHHSEGVRLYGHGSLQGPRLSFLLGCHTKTEPLVVHDPTVDLQMCRLRVRAHEKKGETYYVDLPITEPVTVSFDIAHKEGQMVDFDLVMCYGEDLLGRGTLIVPPSNLCMALHHVPMLDPQLAPIGILRLSCLKVTPFTHPNCSVSSHTYWRALKNFPMIGHRGSGAENAAVKDGYHAVNVQENTVLSFVTAASLGAQYVEFDVQVTADGVPVIYHDFTVGELPVNVPLARLTMNVPPSVGFNIELKVPTRDEVGHENLAEPDLNAYADAVLQCVYDHAGQRDIIFSSFQAEACMIFRLKQPTYPVFFLTESGVVPYSDPRMNSLYQAVQFARSNDLAGIVAQAEPLVECPELINYIKAYGLLVLTWGRSNNTVDCVQTQQRYGVDAVIMDHIAHVRKGLQATMQKNTQTTTPVIGAQQS